MSCTQSFPKADWYAIIKQNSEILTLKMRNSPQTGTLEFKNKVFYSMGLSGNLVCINEPTASQKEAVVGNPNTLSIVSNLITAGTDDFINELSWQPSSFLDVNGNSRPGYGFSLGIGVMDVRGSRIKSDLILDGPTQTYLEIDRSNQTITVWYV